MGKDSCTEEEYVQQNYSKEFFDRWKYQQIISKSNRAPIKGVEHVVNMYSQIHDNAKYGWYNEYNGCRYFFGLIRGFSIRQARIFIGSSEFLNIVDRFCKHFPSYMAADNNVNNKNEQKDSIYFAFVINILAIPRNSQLINSGEEYKNNNTLMYIEKKLVNIICFN